MKHRVYGKHFSRNKDERDLLFKSLVSSLFLRGTIETSLKKATAVKGLVDKLINNAKDKSRAYLLQGYLSDKQLRERLIKEIAPKLGGRNSGYTSLVKLGQRTGDATMMVRMSLIGVEKLGPIVKVVGGKEKTKTVEKGVVKQVDKKQATPKSTPVKKVVAKKPVRKRA